MVLVRNLSVLVVHHQLSVNCNLYQKSKSEEKVNTIHTTIQFQLTKRLPYSILMKRSYNTFLILICTTFMARPIKTTAGVMRYLSQTEAAALDLELFNEYKFSVDQLMELAGLSVATAVAKTFAPSTHKSALIICGPGNNGGDGLVAARHMTLFGYTVTIYYPKRTPKPLYENLLEQCKRFGVNIVEKLPPPKELSNDYKVLVDALFGFSFKPPVREELKPALDALTNSDLPVCSVDIPSGWDVESGPGSEGSALKPAMLISLSAPKLCAKPEILKDAKHFLGGRFLPPGIIKKYNLTLPPYPAQEQVVELV